ncbi:MAG TPA: amino acid adenylation domain-containing protein, partial [Thermoanaerobaculia bacterium]
MSDPAVANRLAGLSREQRALLFEQLRKRKEAAAGAPERIPRRPPAVAPPPASFAQERLWLIDRLQPGRAIYNMPLALRIAGEARLAVLRAVLGEIVRRHEVLRTTFREADGQPAQVIAPPGRWELPLVDLSGLPAGVRDGLARRLAQEEATRPFDLERGPLLRAVLLRLAPAEHALLLTMHHIVSDGWSMGVLVREVTQLYAAAAAGAPSPLPELAIQYADFAVWQRGWLQGERLERQLAYWRERLAGAPAALDLPADRPLPAVRTHAGAWLRVPFGADFQRALALLARRHEATPFMVLFAGFQTLLSRLTGAGDLTVGTPIANRNRAEIEPLIGFFVNTLVLRSDLAGDPSFGDLLARVRKSTLEAYAHQDLPFERLVETLNPERHLATSPLFQVLFAVQNAPVGAVDLPGLSLSPVPLKPWRALFDLELSFWEFGERLEAELTYSTERFDPATVRRLGAHLETLLRGLLADPGRRISTVPLLSGGERHQIVVEWNPAPVPAAAALCLHRRFEAQADRAPGAVALSVPGEDGERLTYGELDARANRIARYLQARGVRPGDRVALRLERSAGMVAAILGVLKAGAAYVPIDPAHPEERIAFTLEDSGAALLLTAEDLEAAARQAPERLEIPPHADSPDLPAYVIYTSGSTGTPKGVVITHANVDRLLTATDPWLGFNSEDVWTLFHSYAFDFSVWEIWGALLYGGRLVVVPFWVSRSPEAFHELLREERVTVLNQTPSAFRQLIWATEGKPADLALRYVVFGGEALEPASLAPWLARYGESPRLINMYGITETTVHVTYRPVEEADLAGGSRIGRPIPDLAVHLLDAALQPVPVGAPGEIHVGGAGLAQGYLNRPDLTAERFVPDPFPGAAGARLYRSGDLARRLPDGDLEYLGRADQQVKISGFRIELGEIEAALGRHPGVREAVVLVRSDRSDGSVGSPEDQRLVAYVVGSVEEPELRRHLAALLPEPMIPAAFVVLDALPLTPNGKVDRRALPSPDPAAGRAREYVTPANAVEEALAAACAELLGVERVGMGDSFFALGGHSLLATRLVSRVRRAFGIELPLRVIFETPTLGDLAAWIERHPEATGAASTPALADRGLVPASFAQERLWFLDRMDPGNPAFNMAMTLSLRGRLEARTLERALNAIVRRHATLRTSFVEIDGRPAQRIAPRLEIPLRVIDLAPLPAAAREPEATRVTRSSLAAPFDLTAGPLVRAALVRLAPDDHLFLLDVHHIVSDGWSSSVMSRELIALYAAFAAGRPSPLPPLPLQYADFARQQREALSGPVLEAQLAYWRGKLGGTLEHLELPTDRPRPAVQTFRGGNLWLEAPEALAEALRRLAREERTSLFMVLLAALDLLLARLSGQDDVVVGSPIAGRQRAETEELIGLFLNTLALRTDLTGDPTFRELLARVRETTLGAYAHQDIPFEALLADLKPARDLSRTPVFQVLLNMLSFPPAQGRLPDGLEIAPGPPPQPESKFDLTLYISEAGGAIRFDLVYNADLFDAPRMEELLRQYRAVLAAAAGDPGRRTGSVSLLTPEAAAVLPDPVRLLPVEEPSMAVHQRFLARARQHPGRPAAVDARGVWTWGDLDAASGRLAARVLERSMEAGVAAAAPVAVWAHRAAPLAAALLGVLRAGAAFAILDPAYPPARLAAAVARVRPRAWVEVPGAPPVPDEVAAALAGVPRFQVEGPGLTVDPAAPCAAVHPDAPAWIAFTSGSTGEPKGIVGSHRPLSHFLGWHERTFGLGEGDRFSLLSGLAHDPLLRDLFTPLWTGGELRVPAPERMGEPGWLAGWLAAEGVTVAHLTPAMARLLALGETAEPLGALRLVCSGGEALTGGDVERLRRLAPRAVLANFYGATETPQAMAWKTVEPGPAPARVPLGRGIDGVDLLVLGRAGEPAGVGELGEICVRTPYLALGYLDDPAGTAERFAPAPAGRLYRTGDLGRYLSGGEVTWARRADRQVKVRGFRIEPAEIEAALVRAGAREAAVVLRSDRSDRSVGSSAGQLVAYVTGGATAAELRQALRAQLPDFMMPALFVALPALPLTPNGKLDWRALPAPRREGAEIGAAPRNLVEEQLAGLWADLLRLDRIGVHDDFFTLGGHSLLATQLVSRLREAFQVELPLRAVFEAPTIAGQAARIERELRTAGGTLAPPVRRVPRDRPLPLSFAQERLWFLHILAPESPVYNMSAAIRLHGRLDAAALAAALSEILRRHETLRTTFRATATGAVQEIQPWAPLPQPVIDLSALPEEARRGEALRVAGEEAGRPFDLARGPLLRALLLRLGEDEHIAVWSTHHVTADAWSLTEAFVPELTQLYAAAVARRPSPLPEPPVQYADYAVWQRDWLRGEVYEEQLGYWRRELAGLAPLELPADRPRPPVPSGRGGAVDWTLPPARAAALGRLARGGDATLFMALFAAFAAALHRETGAVELPVGLPTANRSRGEIEGLIGFFIDTLVLRGDLAADPDFPTLLARSRATVLGALSHQDIPFERLVDELTLPRNPHRPPLLRVIFQLMIAPTQGSLELAGVTLTPVEAGADAAKFDLVVNLFEAAGGIGGGFLYDADLYDAATVTRLTGHFGALLEAWIDTPGRRLADLAVLAAAERHQLLVEWNPAPAVEDGGRLCLHRRFEAQADRAPGAVALSLPGEDGERLTYAELDARANRIARHLQARGVRPGDRVALLLERSAEMVAAILGVLKAGAAYVPIDPNYPAERVAFLRADSGAALLLAAEDLEATARQAPERLEAPPHADSPDLPAYVIYTSGSTGTPKGVVVTHANVDRLLTATDPWFDFGSEDVWTLFHSYAFDFSVWEIWGALLYGGRLVVVPYWVSRSPEAFHELLREERVTVLNQTPSAFRQLIWAAEGKPADLALRYVVFGGEVLEPASLAPWLARYGESPRLINMYGITETTVHVTYRPVGEADLAGGSRIGRPIPDLAVHLLDAGLRPVPVGVPGEIHVGGAGLAQGYLHRPDLTAERFVPDPFAASPGARLYRSGDLARRLPDGDLEYLGRADQQVKIRGFRIELGEIEAALTEQPGVREAVVVVRSDRSDGSDRSVGSSEDRRLVAYLVGEELDAAALRQELARRLPDYMVPAAFVFLDALPLTGHGKVDRRALPAPDAAAPAAAAGPAPRDPLERFLAGQFHDVLALPAERELGVDESFFDLGGTSITTAIFTHRLQEALG